MAPTSAAPRRRAPLIVLIAVLAIAALVAGALLWRDRAGDGQEEAGALAAALARAEAPEHQAVLGPLIEATGAAPQVELADSGSAEDGRRTVTLAWTWILPDGAGTWEYTTEATLERGEDGWAAQLAPEIYAPGLAAGEHLDLRTLEPALGTITDRDGEVLYGEHDVKVLGLDKTRIEESAQEDAARELAGLLGTDPDRYAKAVADNGPEAFVPALTIRTSDEGDYPLVEAAQITGFHASEQTRPLAVERDYAPGVLGALREASSEDVEGSDGEIEAGDLVATGGVVAAEHDALVGTDGVEVLAVGEDADEKRPLHTVDPVDGTAVTTTLDDDLQRRATAAIADEDSPSAVIALQPSSGDVLAAALGPTGQSYPVGLVGQYAPGSTFKTVTALALLREGVTPDTALECPETATIDGASFKNADSMVPSLFGTLPLREVIAHSCNTALLLEHDTVDQPALADAATTLGIGQPTPAGLEAFMGSVDPQDTGT